MYHSINRDFNCSVCGMSGMNCVEWVTREDKTFIRCRVCGHEKLESTYSTASTGGEPVVCQMKGMPEKITF